MMLARSAALLLLVAPFSFAHSDAPSKSAPAVADAAKTGSAMTPLAHVEVRGEGPVQMILIPSSGFDWTVFSQFMSRNAKLYTMHAVTLPGYAGTQAPPAKDTDSYIDGKWVENAEKAILAYIDEKKIGKPVIVGHSQGGHLAQKIALEHPDKVRAVISIDGYPALAMDDPEHDQITREQRLELIRDYIAPTFEKGNLVTMQQQFLPSMVTNANRAAELATIVGKNDEAVLERYTLEFAASDLTPMMGKNTTPILITAAIPDAAVVAEAAALDPMRNLWKKLIGKAPNYTLVFFENTRQFVMDDAPQALDAAIANFLNGKPVEGTKRP